MRARAAGAVAAAVLVCLAVGLSAASSEVADAAMRGDDAALKTLLVRRGVDVNAPQPDGATALHWAVYRDDAAMLDQLLRAGAKPNVTNRVGMTPLAMAALYGSAPIVDRLLKAGADVKATGPNGESMIMYAARNGRPETLRLLIEAGGDVNARERVRGTTALMWAVAQKNAKAVEVLLAAGADHSAKSGGAGLPRNYLAQRVNVRAVEEAQRRHQRAIAAGRTYEQQLEWEFENNIDLGGARNAFVPNRARGGGAGAAGAPAATPAAAAPRRPRGCRACGCTGCRTSCRPGSRRWRRGAGSRR